MKYELDEVAANLGLKTKTQARKRVYAIRASLEKRGYIVYIPERGNALAVTPEGMELLRHLEDFDGTLAERADQLKIELGDVEPPPTEHDLRLLEAETGKRFREVQDQLDDLAERLSTIESRLPWWARILHILPSSRRDSVHRLENDGE